MNKKNKFLHQRIDIALEGISFLHKKNEDLKSEVFYLRDRNLRLENFVSEKLGSVDVPKNDIQTKINNFAKVPIFNEWNKLNQKTNKSKKDILKEAELKEMMEFIKND